MARSVLVIVLATAGCSAVFGLDPPDRVRPVSGVVATVVKWLPEATGSKNFVSEFIIDLDAYRKRLLAS